MSAPLAAGARLDPVFHTQAIFRVLLDAMARPGTPRRLPVADPAAPWPEAGFAAALLQTLIDHEVTFALVAAPGTAPAAARLTGYLAEVTGSRPAPVETADYVLTLGALPAGLPVRLKRGTPAFPDESATLICLVPSWPAEGRGSEVTLRGPGIAGILTTRLPGLDAADLAALAVANAAPPCGIDLILVGAAGDLLCLPRSTAVTPVPGEPPDSSAGAGA